MDTSHFVTWYVQWILPIIGHFMTLPSLGALEPGSTPWIVAVCIKGFVYVHCFWGMSWVIFLTYTSEVFSVIYILHSNV